MATATENKRDPSMASMDVSGGGQDGKTMVNYIGIAQDENYRQCEC